jgi:hypothetical protein
MKNIKTIHLLYFISALYVTVFAVRAYTLGMTHDESGTYCLYCNRPMLAYFLDMETWTMANNHLLNTFLINASVRFFNAAAFTVRLPNIIAGVVFCIYLIKIIKHLQLSKLLSISFFVMVMSNTFFIDWFSVARGYGLCVAASLACVYYVLLYCNSFKSKYLFYYFISALLMVLANFIGLHFLVASNCIILLFVLINNKAIFIKTAVQLALGSAVIIAPIVKILVRLSANGEFTFGSATLLQSAKSYLNDIMYDGGHYGSNGTNYFVLAYSIALIFAIIFLFKNIKNTNAVVLIIYPIIMVGVMVAVHCITGAQYSDTRKLILFYPPMAMMVFYGIKFFYKLNKQLGSGIFMALSLFLIINLHQRTSLHSVREWWYDAHTFKVFNYVNATTNNKTIACNWLFHPVLTFYKTVQPNATLTIAQYNKEIVKDTAFDYYYVLESDTANLMNKYSIDSIFAQGYLLLKKK